MCFVGWGDFCPSILREEFLVGNRLIRPHLAGFALSRYIECANLISNFVPFIREHPKKITHVSGSNQGWPMGSWCESMEAKVQPINF